MKTSLYLAGWRPFIGWVCGISLAWNFIVLPILLFAVWMMPSLGYDVSTAPHLEVGELMTVVLGMLGLGVQRSYEKRMGVDTKSMQTNQQPVDDGRITHTN